MSTLPVDLPVFEPEEWKEMNQHQKVQSIFWDEGSFLNEHAVSMYLDTGDDEPELLYAKIRAAKYAYRCVLPKMLEDEKTSRKSYFEESSYPGSDDDDDDGDSYHGYTENHLLKFSSALRYNYPFEMCFKVESETKKEFKKCICPCTKNNKAWRKLFKVDYVDSVEQCNKNQLTSVEGILQHLRMMHQRGNCYSHSVSYFYILKLYGDIVPSQFLRDLPPEPLEFHDDNNNDSQSKATTASRKRKPSDSIIDSTDVAHNGSSSRQTKISKITSSTLSTYPPSSIVCHHTSPTTKPTDSSTISSVTKFSNDTNDIVISKKPAQPTSTSSNIIQDGVSTKAVSAVAAAKSVSSKEVSAVAAAKSVSTKAVSAVAAAKSVSSKEVSTVAAAKNVSSKVVPRAAAKSVSSKVVPRAAAAVQSVSSRSVPTVAAVQSVLSRSVPTAAAAQRSVSSRSVPVPAAAVAARRSIFRVTEANRTRVEGNITINYHSNMPLGINKTTRRNFAKYEISDSEKRELSDFIYTNRIMFTGEEVKVVDSSSGKLCKGHGRCFGSEGREYHLRRIKRIGDPTRRFEWVIKLSNHPADLYLSNTQMKDIVKRDGSEERPYFSLFIGRPVFPSHR